MPIFGSRFLLAVFVSLILAISSHASLGLAQEQPATEAVETPAPKAEQETPAVEPDTTADLVSELVQQNELLRAQYNEVRWYHSTLVDTVYWVLGFAGAIFLVVIFVNIRVSGREVEAIRSELHGDITEKLAEASKDLETRISNLREGVDARVHETLSEIKTNAGEELNSIDEKISNKNKPIYNRINEINSKIESNYKEIFLEIHEIQADIAVLNKLDQSALSSWIRYLSVANSAQDFLGLFWQERGLSAILDLLKEKQLHPSASNLADLNSALEGCDEKYALLVREIHNRISGDAVE